MFKVLFKGFVLAVMLVAFIGQTFAFNSAMPCDTSANSHADNISNRVTSTESITKESITKESTLEECCDIECCDIDCICIANACSSVVYFYIETGSSKTAVLNEIFYLSELKQPRFIARLLYRPPIYSS